MIFSVTLVSFTLEALRQPAHFASVSWLSWAHDVSLNGPFVTMFFGSVHLSPYFSTVALFTARNDVWLSCPMNQGCVEVRTILSVYLSGAERPTFAFSLAQSVFFGSHPLYSAAPLIPKNWYA